MALKKPGGALMSILIGFGLTILGGVLSAVTGITPFIIITFVGIFLFASFHSEDIFFDYRIVNTEEFLLRKRHYINFLPFTIVSSILTLKKAPLKIVWKEEYFKVSINAEKDLTKLSRKEYITLRNEQRNIYSTQVLGKEFMKSSYTEADIGFKRKKARLIAASVFAGIMLTMIVEPGGIYLTLIYESIFLPMIILWIPDYIDAKILHKAYNKALNESASKT